MQLEQINDIDMTATAGSAAAMPGASLAAAATQRMVLLVELRRVVASKIRLIMFH